MDRDTARVPRRRETLAAHADNMADDAPLMDSIRFLGYRIFGFRLCLLFDVAAGKKSNHGGKRTWWNTTGHFAPSSVGRGSWLLVLTLALGIALNIGVLYILSQRYGWQTVLRVYIISHALVNCWIAAITTLHRAHEADIFRHIIEHHVAHQVKPTIPGHRLTEATMIIVPLSGEEHTIDGGGDVPEEWTGVWDLGAVVSRPSPDGRGTIRVWKIWGAKTRRR